MRDYYRRVETNERRVLFYHSWIPRFLLLIHSTKSSMQGLILNLPVLFEAKIVGDSGFTDDRIVIVSNSSELLCTCLSFVFTRLYSYLICLWCVFTRLYFSLIRLHSSLHSSVLVSHLSLILSVFGNIW